MKIKVKEMWIDALTSGEYEQGQGLLNKDGKFCCLGVLEDLYAKEHGVKWIPFGTDALGEAMVLDLKGGCTNPFTLAEEVQVWAGLNDSNPSVNGDPLAWLNDKADMSFNQIATLIEENF